LSNLIEFVLLSDPQSAASQASLTQVTTATGSELSFIRAREIGDYEAKILWSSDLVTWSDAGLELTETELNDGETVVSASIPLSPFGHGYFRIEVSEQ